MKKTKKSNSVVIVAIALILLAVTAALVINAYARYANTFTKTATATSATWNFEDGDSQTDVVLVAEGYENLKEGTIAPGTSGSFDISLNATGSETGVKYTVTLGEIKEINAADNQVITTDAKIPTGLTVSLSDGEGTGYIPYSNDMSKVVTVNWEWSLGEDLDSDTGDDNIYAGRKYAVVVNVRGESFVGEIPANN